jgi:hypothetical protein
LYLYHQYSVCLCIAMLHRLVFSYSPLFTMSHFCIFRRQSKCRPYQPYLCTVSILSCVIYEFILHQQNIAACIIVSYVIYCYTSTLHSYNNYRIIVHIQINLLKKRRQKWQKSHVYICVSMLVFVYFMCVYWL